MKNYVQSGDTLTLTAPYARLAGQGALVGSIFGVSASDVASGAEGEFRTFGVYTLTKNSAEAWTVGQRVYWDDTNKRVTTVSTANTLIGAATVAAANPSAVGNVRLNGTF